MQQRICKPVGLYDKTTGELDTAARLCPVSYPSGVYRGLIINGIAKDMVSFTGTVG
jgi:hypothetical protein